MVANFQECNYLFSERSEIVKELPIRLNPKKIEKLKKIKLASSEKNLTLIIRK